MVHFLYILGALALMSLATLIIGFHVTRNGFKRREDCQQFSRLMFYSSIVCVVSGVAWVILAVINWWDVWIASTAVVLLFLYVISPTITRNHDGETLVIWFNTKWLKHDGKWVKR